MANQPEKPSSDRFSNSMDWGQKLPQGRRISDSMAGTELQTIDMGGGVTLRVPASSPLVDQYPSRRIKRGKKKGDTSPNAPSVPEATPSYDVDDILLIHIPDLPEIPERRPITTSPTRQQGLVQPIREPLDQSIKNHHEPEKPEDRQKPNNINELSPTENMTLQIIIDSVQRTGWSPQIKEIGQKINYTHPLVLIICRKLEEKGFLTRDPQNNHLWIPKSTDLTNHLIAQLRQTPRKNRHLQKNR